MPHVFRKLLLGITAAVLVTLGSASNILADPITITIGNPGNQDTDNVLFNNGSLHHSGLVVQGDFNSAPGFIVDFTSASGSGNLGVSGGQAVLVGGIGNTPFSNTTVQLENGATFKKLILNIDVTNGLPPPTQVQFTVNYTLAGGQVFSQVFSVNTNGENFFGIEALEGAVINSVTVQGLGGTTFQDIDQWRLGGFANANPVPEPASMLLFGSGPIGTAGALRRRLK